MQFDKFKMRWRRKSIFVYFKGLNLTLLNSINSNEMFGAYFSSNRKNCLNIITVTCDENYEINSTKNEIKKFWFIQSVRQDSNQCFFDQIYIRVKFVNGKRFKLLYYSKFKLI